MSAPRASLDQYFIEIVLNVTKYTDTSLRSTQNKKSNINPTYFYICWPNKNDVYNVTAVYDEYDMCIFC